MIGPELLAARYLLPNGVACELSAPPIPGVADYAVLAPCAGAEAGGCDLEAFYALAARVAQRLARARFGDPGCYALLTSGAQTRRAPWPHIHIILADSVAAKRRALGALYLKHLTRPVVHLWRRARALLLRPGGSPRRGRCS